MDNLKIEKCRGCDSEELIPILSLGNQYVTNFIESEEEQNRIPRIPLDLILCKNCKLLQLRHNAPSESVWNQQYWYKSGISSTIITDLKDIVEKSKKLVELKNEDIVIDIGCNDGTMLEFYDKDKNLDLVGFEPSGNVAREAQQKGFNIINNFFNAKDFKKEFGNKKAKIITAISMFYDLDKPNEFLKDIVSCLDKNGLFIIQQNYLLTMIENNAFDNICHEHREYYSLISLKNLLNKYNLEIFDVEQNEINGGSIRTYIKFEDNKNLRGFKGAEERIDSIIKTEEKTGLETLKPYKKFADRIFAIKMRLVDFLRQEKEKGKNIWIYGASTRGNVALQYFRLGPSLITCIADMNPDKWKKKTVGSLIPIASPEDMRKSRPDYLLVNTWHFFDEIKKQENIWFQKGGVFLLALPQFRIIKKIN